MSLEDFRGIADERTKQLVMTPELSRRILRNVKKKPVSRTVWAAAAACFAIMVVSGVALFTHMNASSDDIVVKAQLGGVTDTPTAHIAIADGGAAQGDATRVSDVVAQDVSIQGIDLAALPEPAAIGEYSEGYAPARNEEGLWGYVDQGGKWVIPPVYAQVNPVKNLQATAVRIDGATVMTLFQAAQ